MWHSTTVSALLRALDDQLPDGYLTLRHMAIERTRRTAPEPDISIARSHAVNLDTWVLQPQHVIFAAEVTTPESEERDREDKPHLYAAMGIPTFWLVEPGPDYVLIVHEHQLHGGAYRLVRTHVGTLTTEIPFPIEIPLGRPQP